MLLDESCFFLAADFDKASWMDDARAFLETCRRHEVPAALERSRSGHGAHVWIFFAEPVPAAQARRLGAFLFTRTMERRPEIGLDSYDRLFPSQDTLPEGGFGNLIALPLQARPRSVDNSVFVDDDLRPYPDQWAFLSSIARMRPLEVEAVVKDAKDDELLAVRAPYVDGTLLKPWLASPSREGRIPEIEGPVPQRIGLVIGNQIYIPKSDLSPSLRNRLIRLAAFQNPGFYRAQAMRLSTFGKPRIISCCEGYPEHLGLPRGCLDDLVALLDALGVDVTVDDRRSAGESLRVDFLGKLRPEQASAAALLKHEFVILSAATAFGKTVVAAHLIARRGVNTLIVVHRRQLLEQWTATLSRFLSLAPDDIGAIGGGKRAPTGKVDVAMIQSLVRKGIVDDVVGDYGHVIVDECHHISAVSFERVVRQARTRFVTGLSATIVRKDGHHPIIMMQCGPIRHQVDDRKQAERRPFDHHVVVRRTPFELSSSNGALPHVQEVYTMLAENDRRNRMIVADVVRAVDAGRSPVVLTERRRHVDLLAERLSARLPNVFALVGGMSKTRRKALMDEISSVDSAEPRVIVSTGRYLGEGFDDRRLDTLFLTLPVSWRGTIAQYAGRLHRVEEGKRDAVVYDYVDARVPMLARMHERRCAAFRTLGYEIRDEPAPEQLSLLGL